MKTFFSVAVVAFAIYCSSCEDVRNNFKVIGISETDLRDPKFFGLYAVLRGGSQMSGGSEFASRYQNNQGISELDAHQQGNDYKFKPETHFETVFFPLYQNFGYINTFKKSRALVSSTEGGRKRTTGYQRNKRSLEGEQPIKTSRQNDEDDSNDNTDNSSETPDMQDSNNTTTTPPDNMSGMTNASNPHSSYYPSSSGSFWKPDQAWATYYPPSPPSITGCSHHHHDYHHDYHHGYHHGTTYPHHNYYNPQLAVNHDYTSRGPLFEDIHYVALVRPPLLYHPYSDYYGQQFFKPSHPDYYQDNAEHHKYAFYPNFHKK